MFFAKSGLAFLLPVCIVIHDTIVLFQPQETQ